MVDEVQTGVCRSGQFWGHQKLNVDVDVLTTAKALGGGVPIGAMLCKDKCNVFQPGESLNSRPRPLQPESHAHTRTFCSHTAARLH
jgi:acetylornithine/succinyldiaminopimelate/putrescine aminotransferase